MDLLSGALSPLHVRVLLPDQDCCTLLYRLGAGNELRSHGFHAVARKSATQCAKSTGERFVTGLSHIYVQLANYDTRIMTLI